jgi:hypothetical protein
MVCGRCSAESETVEAGVTGAPWKLQSPLNDQPRCRPLPNMIASVKVLEIGRDKALVTLLPNRRGR